MSATKNWPPEYYCYSEQYVWYCSYGSNINSDRFSIYLKGGKPIGSGQSAPHVSGSRISTPPLDSQPILLRNTQMLFSRVSRTWSGGGVCFTSFKNRNENNHVKFETINNLKCFGNSMDNNCCCSDVGGQDFENVVLGRIHKILWHQFVDVVSQENGGTNCHLKEGNSIQQSLDSNYNEIINRLQESGGEFKMFDTWYGSVVLIGFHPIDNCPIISFTTSEFQKEIVNRAHESYLKTVGKGIMDTFEFCAKICALYFLSKPGVKEFYSLTELLNVMQ